jgi:hypothetical protein
MLSQFGDELSFVMAVLQRNIGGVIRGPGELGHTECTVSLLLLISQDFLFVSIF